MNKGFVLSVVLLLVLCGSGRGGALEELRQKARTNACINNLRMLNVAVEMYAVDYDAPEGTVPPEDYIWGAKDSCIREVLVCPEGTTPYTIPKVGELPVCPNVSEFPDHKLPDEG